MSVDISNLFPSAPAAPPAFPGHPSQVQPGGRRIVRDSGHPCHGCALEELHNAWGRIDWEEGAEDAIPPEYAQPGRAWLMRLQEIASKAQWAMAQYPALTGAEGGLELAYPYDIDAFTEAMPVILAGEVVGASGSNLVVRSFGNPRDLEVQRFVENPRFGLPGEDYLLYKPVRSRLQPGDRITLSSNSPLHRRVQPSVVAFVAAWGGPGSTYQIACDQSVVNAHKRVVQANGPISFRVYRHNYPEHWPTIREPAPLRCVRHEIAVAWADIATLPTPRRLELFNTSGGICRIAIPVVDGGAMQGTFTAIRRRAGESEDISAALAARVQIAHATGGYRTHLLLEEPTPLLQEDDTLRLWYHPEATGSETGDVRVPCQATCRHAHEHAGVSACGLAGRVTTPTQDVPWAPDPPTGAANFRSVAQGGCYQTTCSDWQVRTPWSIYHDIAAYVRGLINGVAVRFDQRAPTSVEYDWVRPLPPDGVPGLRAALGTNHKPNTLPSVAERDVIAGGLSSGRRGAGSTSEMYRGAESDDADTRLDYGARVRPEDGLLKNETFTSFDPLGRPWSDETDPTQGYRRAGWRLFGAGQSYGGTDNGLVLGDMRKAQRHKSMLFRVSLDREGLQSQPWGTAQIQEDGSLLLAWAALRNGNRSVSVFGDPIIGYAPTQLVSGVIASASNLGGGKIAIEVENQARAGTLADGSVAFLSGGNFCKLPSYYLANDAGDAESRFLGDNCRRGATPGYACRVLGLDPENAAQLAAMGTGYIVDVAQPHGGADGGWGESGEPTWPAMPNNFADWGSKRDRVVLFDRDDGVLASVVGSLVGATITCEISGVLSPVPRSPMSLRVGPYAGPAAANPSPLDWAQIPAEAIELIDYWAGRVLLSADWVAAQTERVICVELETDFFDDSCQVDAEIFTELRRWLGALFPVRLGDVAGSPGILSGSISQVENPFADGWCITAWQAKDAEGRPNYYTLITDPSTIDPAILTSPTNYCADGFILEDDAIQIDNSNDVAPPISSSVQVRLQSSAGSTRMYPLFRAINFDFPVAAAIDAQVLARESWDSASIVRVVGSLAMDGIVESRTTETWTNSTTHSGELVVTTGTAQVRVALYGLKKRPDSATMNRWAILATSEPVTVSDGSAQDVDLTPLVRGLVQHKTSEYVSFAVMAVPADVAVSPDTTPEQAVNSAMPEVTWTNYEPIYSSCSGLAPVDNPDLANRAGEYESIDLTWSGFAITNILATLQPRAAFGAKETTPIDSAGGHWPPAA